MNDQQFDLLMEALHRIAAALEAANLREMYPPIYLTPMPTPAPAAYPTAPAGYTCPKCFGWVPSGNAHACGSTWNTGG